MLREKLKNTCSFAAALEDKDETGYPRAELFYVRAYHDGSHWWNTVFHIHKGLMVPALVEEVDKVYVAFQKAFPDVKAVRDYIDHHGAAGQVFIQNLAVEYAQMIGASIGNLCIKASNGQYYIIDVDGSGNVTATLTMVTEQEIDAGQTEAGRVILETSITASDLNTGNLLATFALVNQIDAARIDVDQLFARQAFIDQLNTSVIQSQDFIQLVVGQVDDTVDDAMKDATPAVLRIDSSRGTVFKDNNVSTVLSVSVHYGKQIIENMTVLRATFGASAHLQWEWLRMDEDRYGIISADDTRLSDGGFRLTLGPADVDVKVTFRCTLITD